MNGKTSSLEARMEQLAEQVAALTAQVEKLSAAMNVYDASPPENRAPSQKYESAGASEQVLSWVGKSSLLQRLSTLCFLLVIALILRTVTDNGIINLRLGSVIGMIYAASLMLMGWRRYQRSNPLAPIFTVCGTVLMFMVVVETHAHYESLSSVPAYILLMLTGLGTAVISAVYRVPAPLTVGNLGMCLAAAAIDYPSPFFPYLGIVLLTANLLGFFATRADRYAWLRWIVLLVTLYMIHLWGIHLGKALLANEKPAQTLAQAWFMPFLTLFAITYIVMAFLDIRRNFHGRLHKLELMLPTINAIWTFLLAAHVGTAMGNRKIAIGFIGVILGAGHLAIALRLAGHDQKGARGANAFVFAGSVLLSIALPVAMDSMLLSLPLLSALALGIAWMSEKWQSGSVRLTSYLLQVYAGAALAVVLLLRQEPSAAFLASMQSAGSIAFLGLMQYKWCRSHKPPEESTFFSRKDKGDYSIVIVFLSALLSAFLMCRVIVYQVFGVSLAPGDLDNAFRCSQSIIINISAIMLMLLALTNRSREVRNVAILVTIMGAARVFLFDLINARGVPLVMSVLSFGLVTAIESVILKRWQHLTPPAEETGPK